MSFTAIAAIVSAAYSAYSLNEAAEASAESAEEAADYNADILKRKASGQRTTMVENLRRQREDKSRYMAGLNVHQAASGVLTDTGSPVMIREKIGSRLDENINDYTSQALASESYTRSQESMTRYAGQQFAAQTLAAGRMEATGTLLGGIGKGIAAYNQGKGSAKPKT